MQVLKLWLAALAMALGSIGASAQSDDAPLRRSMFRTYALQQPSAPRDTIAKVTDCAMEALRGVSPAIRRQIIEIDRVQDGRSGAYQRWAFAQTDPALAPFGRCSGRLLDGEFGPLRGAPAIATAAPNPSNVPACPSDGTRVQGEELTCYCAPLQGGVAYGSRIFADESTICIAAQRASVFDFLTGGVVRAVFQPGCASYPSAAEPTGPTASLGRTPRSFYFPSVGPGACPR